MSRAANNDEKAAARFFLRVAQAGAIWSDRNTLPLFPLMLVMDAEMLEADAKHEAQKCPSGCPSSDGNLT